MSEVVHRPAPPGAPLRRPARRVLARPGGPVRLRSRQPRPAGRDDGPRRQRRVRDQEPAAARPARRQVPRLPLRSGARRDRQLAARPGARLRRLHRRPQLARVAGPRSDCRRHRRGRPGAREVLQRGQARAEPQGAADARGRRCPTPRQDVALSCSVRRSTASWRSPARCSPRTPRASTPSTTPSSTTASTTSTGAASPRIYGYESASPSIDDFVLWIFRKAIERLRVRPPRWPPEHPARLRQLPQRPPQPGRSLDAGEARVGRPRLQGEHPGRQLPRPCLGRPVRGDRPQDHRDLARAVTEQTVTAREVG